MPALGSEWKTKFHETVGGEMHVNFLRGWLEEQHSETGNKVREIYGYTVFPVSWTWLESAVWATISH